MSDGSRLRVREVLGDDSALARLLPGYTQRDGQLAMAEAVEAALAEERPLMVEAGTGTGKTLAYLLPAVLSGRKVIVSTATRALQEQIYFKDLPLVRELLGAFGVTFRAALMKGLSNYLCRRRYAERLGSGEGDAQLWRLRTWAEDTETGDRSELADMEEDDPLWAEVASSTDTRIGAECTYYDDCFVTRMKRDAEEADVVVVNHHLFCADLVLRRGRRERASAIPAYDAVIFDEAHQLEDVATTFFGSSISMRRVDSLARDARRTLGLQGGSVARPLYDQLRDAAGAFFEQLASAPPPRGDGPKSARLFGGGGRRALGPRDWTSELVAARLRFEAALDALAHSAQTEAGAPAEQIARRATEMQRVLAAVSEAREDDEDERPKAIGWVESRGGQRGGVTLGQSPVFLGGELAETLFSRVPTVVCTSATLTTPGEHGPASFDFLKERIGAPAEAPTLRVPSPFDFQARAGMYVPRDVPDPSDPRFDEAAAKRASELLDLTGGGAFILCTSLRSMRAMYERLSRARAEHAAAWGPLLLQGERPKSLLLSQFRAAKHAVLVATMSFWEGVDVPGHALRLVVLDKLPFPVPSDPVVAARCDAIEREGQSAFFKYSVPAAAISLKQGFGRLLRSEHDAGLVALLDRRVLTKSYGRALLSSLPPARALRNMDEVRGFWAEVFPGPEA